MRFLALLLLIIVPACTPREPRVLEGSTVTSRDRTVLQTADRQVVLDRSASNPAVVAAEVSVPLEALWQALPAAFTDVGLRGAGVIDESARIFGFPDAVIPSRVSGTRLSAYLNCGSHPGGAIADIYRVTGSVLVAVRPGKREGSTIIELSIQAVGKPRSTSGAPVQCTSNGRLEQEIAQTAMVRVSIDL